MRQEVSTLGKGPAVLSLTGNCVPYNGALYIEKLEGLGFKSIIFCVSSAIYCHSFIPFPFPLIGYAHHSSTVIKNFLLQNRPFAFTLCWALCCGEAKPGVTLLEYTVRQGEANLVKSHVLLPEQELYSKKAPMTICFGKD